MSEPPVSPADPWSTDGEPEATPPAETPEETPQRWVGSAPVSPSGKRGRRPLADDTQDLPVYEDWPPPPPPPAPNPLRPVTAPLGSWPTEPGPRPPQWRPPARPAAGRPPRWVPPQRRRRRRRWPWVMFVLTLLTAFCCCGCLSWAKPFYDQYPTTVAAPPQRVAGLVRLDVPTITEPLKVKVRTERLLAENVFAEVYTDDRSRRITVAGATGFILDPESDLDGEMAKLQLADVQAVEPGPLGGHQRCGKASAGPSGSVCAWADHGSIAVATFAGRGVADSAQLLRELRKVLVQRT
jgi:hypothetical protein